MNAKKVVLYYDNASDYAKGIADEFKREYKGKIVTEATFASGDKDYQSALTKFKWRRGRTPAPGRRARAARAPAVRA